MSVREQIESTPFLNKNWELADSENLFGKIRFGGIYKIKNHSSAITFFPLNAFFYANTVLPVFHKRKQLYFG